MNKGLSFKTRDFKHKAKFKKKSIGFTTFIGTFVSIKRLFVSKEKKVKCVMIYSRRNVCYIKYESTHWLHNWVADFYDSCSVYSQSSLPSVVPPSGEFVELQVDYWTTTPRSESSEKTDKASKKDSNKCTLKTTFRSLQVQRLAQNPVDLNSFSMVVVTKEKKHISKSAYQFWFIKCLLWNH